MACGVIVLTLKMDMYQEVYGDSIVMIDRPNDLSPDFVSDKFIDAIEKLENEPILKNKYITKGKTIVRKLLWEHAAEKILRISM